MLKKKKKKKKKSKKKSKKKTVSEPDQVILVVICLAEDVFSHPLHFLLPLEEVILRSIGVVHLVEFLKKKGLDLRLVPGTIAIQIWSG